MGAAVAVSLIVATTGPDAAASQQTAHVKPAPATQAAVYKGTNSATVAQVRAQEKAALSGFGMGATQNLNPASNTGMKSTATVHPNDVPMYYHRCFSFIDYVFHVKTQNCPGLIYRFSTYTGDWEYVSENVIRQHGYDVAYSQYQDYLWHRCFGTFFCSSLIGSAYTSALKLGWKLTPRAWAWARIGIAWIIDQFTVGQL
jgi:hypothetical protein